MRGSVLVLGSGISGMRAAAELVQQGFKVFLVESKPTIGGTMAMLDKMYPTNECATCTQLPKMLELTSNPNINVMAYADLESVEKKDGGFSVRVVKKVRYVDPMKCNACTECFPACPVGGIPMEFNLGRGKSKAISFWSPFPPRKAMIDPEACTYIKEGRCGEGTTPLCEKACEPGAIDFFQKPSAVQIEVGAIIVAVGSEEERSDSIGRLGHGRFANVLTSLEYERLLSGLGPTGGVIKRDDGKVPKRVAWIVCEDFDGKARESSSVCFMTATAEALGTLERDGEAQVTVISAGSKSDAKGYNDFCSEAEKRGVRYTTASSVDVRQAVDGNVSVACSGKGGDSPDIEADLLILSTPLVPLSGVKDLAGKLGIEVDGRGFPKRSSDDRHPLLTTRAGVFVCGTVAGSKGIRESVIQACAAAALASARLSDARGTEVAPPPDLKLLPVKAGDEPKLAVVLCRCGANIAGVVDVQELASYLRAQPQVSRVEVTPFGCDGVKIKELLATGEYNRIVVGACSPRTHEPLFQMITEAGGINRYLLEIVNLRNQCTWVHANDKGGVSRKARALMRAGMARAALLEPLEPIRIPVTQSCLVVGGTLAGLACAAKLGEMGFTTHLVISESKPGADLAPEAKDLAGPVLKALTGSGRVHVYPRAEIGRLEGYVGSYKAEIVEAKGKRVVEIGSIVIATHEKLGRANGNGDFESDLHLSRDDDGFFVGALGNLNPLDFNTDGVFMCGSARELSNPAWSLMSGEGAACRAAAIISRREMAKAPVVSHIVDANCDGCAYCIEPCPAHAITLIEYMKEDEIKKTVEVNEALCRGCGMCMATCPKQGAYVRHFKPEQFSAMVSKILEVA
jgi:heterodisulfide reductase subunit A